MKRTLTIVCAALFACSAVLIASRTFNSVASPGLVDGRLADFRDAVYLPGKALLHGDNPYDTPNYMRAYPEAGQDFPLYAPAHLILAIPFVAMSLSAARAVHFVLTLGLLVYLAHLSLQWVGRRSWAATFGLAAFLVVSLPGRVVLQTGQTTVLSAIGVVNAWRYRDRPWVAGAWLALAMFKPVIGLPVAAVFVVVRYVRPAVIVLGITVALSIPVLVACIVSAGGVGGFADSIHRNLSYFDATPSVLPRTGGSADLVSFVARVFAIDIGTRAWILLSIPILASVLYVVFRSWDVTRDFDVMALALPGILLVNWQPNYHAILLTPVVIWIALGPTRFRYRWVIVALLSWLFVSPFATQRFAGGGTNGRGLKELLGSPLSTVCTVVAFGLLAHHFFTAAASSRAAIAAESATPSTPRSVAPG